jgi:integrase
MDFARSSAARAPNCFRVLPLFELAAPSARTVGHAHRVLHKALADAVARELLLRNPASLVSPPKIENSDVAILSAAEVKTVLDALQGTEIYPHIVVLLSTGMRRRQLMGLQWGDIDLEDGKLWIGKLAPTHHVFGDIEGSARHPGWLTDRWSRVVKIKKLPHVTLYALRHSHASALIASGRYVVTVSRRLGHANPTITLSGYAHLVDKTDEAAATAIDSILKPKENKS